LNHPVITTRSVEDIALLLDILAERNEQTKKIDFISELAKNTKLRIGVANNFRKDQEISDGFVKTVETIRNLGFPMSITAAPFGDPTDGISNIEADRKAISKEAFEDIDMLLLPTTSTIVPTIKDAGTNPQALSPENTAFANYYGLPAISVPCGFDRHGLPLGLQIVGKPWDDATVLRLAYQYQIATDYGKKHPIM
jgi:aspartyl-tRNA(Asn)/glutamyl-tRNA(Gln) amidotransferase subunit A